MTLFHHPKPRPTYRIVSGVTRAGSVGVGIYRDGKLVGWGLNETAAWVSVRVNAA